MGSVCSPCHNNNNSSATGGTTTSSSPPSASAPSSSSRIIHQAKKNKKNRSNSRATTTMTAVNTNSSSSPTATPNNNGNNSSNNNDINNRGSNSIVTTTDTTMTSTNPNATLAQQVSMALETIQRLGINLLAIDFDQTMINLHTGGQWKGTARELARHVRPEFQELIHQVQRLRSGGIDICIVTFSPQVQLIRHVMEEGTTWNHTISVTATTEEEEEEETEEDRTSGTTNSRTQQMKRVLPLVIRGGDRSWSYGGGGSLEGKQPHMASAVEELEGEHERIITKQTTLLIDDDSKNVRCALRDGVRAIWFNPRRPQDLLPDMIRLV